MKTPGEKSARLVDFVPGVRRGRSPWVAMVFSFYFYSYLAILVCRGGRRTFAEAWDDLKLWN